MTGEAVAAAVAVARDFGVSVVDPVVLADGSNVLVWLRPAPVVARVAKLTALVRPGVEAWLARDISVSAYVGARGVPAVTPSVDPPAGPHHRDGQVLAFFEYVPHSSAGVGAPAEVASALTSLHSALDGYDGELPAAGPVDDLRLGHDLLEREGILTGSVLARLRADLEFLAVEIRAFPVRPLHGDAHPGNLLSTPDGLVWNDFEDAWRGPLAWDLACMARTRRLDGVAALASYPGSPTVDDLGVYFSARRLQGQLWTKMMEFVMGF